MTTFIALLVLTAVVALLVSYARHDRFAGPASSAHPIDELGPSRTAATSSPAPEPFRRAQSVFCLT